MRKGHSPDKTRTRKPKEELVYDHTGAVDVEETRAERGPAQTRPIEYTPPPPCKTLLTVYAVSFLQGRGWTDASRRVLTYLIKCANAHTGACFPSILHISGKLGLNKRTVERSVGFLTTTPYLARERRGVLVSNAYHINWKALLAAFDAFEGHPSLDVATEARDATVTREARDTDVATTPVYVSLDPGLDVALKLKEKPSIRNHIPKGDDSGKSLNALLLNALLLLREERWCQMIDSPPS